MPAPDASNSKLRELLKFGDGGGDAGDELRRNAVAKITLAAVLSADRRRSGRAEMSRTLIDILEDESAGGSQMSRTLFDIISAESAGGAAVYGAHLGQSHTSRNNWKAFKDLLGLRRGGAASWTGGSPARIPASSASIPHSSEPAQPENSALLLENGPSQGQIAPDSDESTRNERLPPRGIAVRAEPESAASVANSPRLGAILAAERVRLSEAEEGDAPARMSLMALLEETDRQMGIVGPAYGEYVDENGGGGGVGDDGVERGHSADLNCCVCMVRQKGAAFIPCGHTFCRLCSRELWVSRGSCPICNNVILEILDIF